MSSAFFAIAILLLALTPSLRASLDLRLSPDASPRIRYGADQLAAAVPASGASQPTVLIGTIRDPALRAILPTGDRVPGPEGFTLISLPEGKTAVIGGDDSGALYGCLELAQRTKLAGGGIPAALHFSDQPAFTVRGPCFGLQKPYILPGRHVYEYPIEPKLFPYFYDRQYWSEYLDFLGRNRMNTLFIWAGHPFASLIRVPEYPEAVEVSPELLARNQEMFHFVVQEADKRGIRISLQFYSILVSKPFATAHKISTQLKAPTPLVSNYTRKSIAAFVKEYPQVELYACLGEALQGLDNQIYWMNQVILPGIKDGLKAAGIAAYPPVLLRTHAIGGGVEGVTKLLKEALQIYPNIDTEQKFNGESLTTWEPRGEWRQQHLAVAKLATVHVANIHILANLEPFRYGDQRFIQLSVKAARDRLGAKGLHLYPLSYWNWPDAPDIAEPPLKQWDRDWIWFEAWARYAWNPDIDEATDHHYWVGRMAEHYGSAAAAGILEAYNDSGECAPRLIRRFGITEGNRQTLSLGMTLDQLVHPDSYGAITELWESQSPPGERLQEYADREWNHQPHAGETPPQIVREVLDYSRRAVAAIEQVAPLVTQNRAEFERVRNDMHCIEAMCENYGAKVNAAMSVLRFEHSHDPRDQEAAQRYLADSLQAYRTLAKLTAGTYRYANSMQTKQRKIPVVGGVGTKPINFTWTQLVPTYEKELADFPHWLAGATEKLQPAPFRLLSPGAETYTLAVGERVFSDRPDTIKRLAPQMEGLTAIRSAASGGPLEIETTGSVRVLIGYFRSSQSGWRQIPNLETDAAAAGSVATETYIKDAAAFATLPPVEVHLWTFGPGKHLIEPPGSGIFLVLGVSALP